MNNILKKNLENKNIVLLYVYNFLSTFLLFRSCDTLYYLSKGVTSSKYIFFTVVSSVLVILFQIPIGVIGDKINKKIMLLVSNLLIFLSIIFYIISNSYIGLMMGIIFQTMQSLFANGIVNSILYDEVQNKDEFPKIIFIKSIFSYTGYGIAMVLGGVVADINLVYMYYISLIPVIINFFVLFGLHDIKIKKNSDKSFKNIFKDAKDIIKENKVIQYILLYEGILMAIITILAESHPEYSSKLGVSGTVIGIYTALMLVFGILGEFIGSKIKSNRIKIFLIPLIVALVTILVGVINNVLGIIFIVLAQFFYDIQYNGMISLMHDNINDQSRVTMEGVLSLSSSIFGIIIGVFTSILLKYMSVDRMFIVIGFLLIISVVILFIKYRRSFDE